MLSFVILRVIKGRHNINDFVSRLKLQVYKCDFREDKELKDRILDQCIAGTSHAEMQKKLLSESKNLSKTKQSNKAVHMRHL